MDFLLFGAQLQDRFTIDSAKSFHLPLSL